MTILQSGVIPASGGYEISRSLRFNPADTAYLNRTFSTPTSRNIWTWSGWIKRSALGNTAGYRFFEGGDGTSANSGFIGFGDGTGVECIRFYNRLSSTTNIDILTTAVFRDVSAWYHVVVAYDSAQVTQANKLLMYVNGVNYTWSGTAPSSSQTSAINTNTYVHNIGVSPWNTSTYFSGYLTEINFIDGQALTPSSFGQTNASTGVWEPVKYTGTYGTNGFYLNFSDNSNTTSTTLGKDSSGNGNNWTPNLFSVAAGVGNDSLVDTPTSYGTDTGVGGEVRGNYATLNPLNQNSTGVTLANGNLDITRSSASNGQVWSTMGMTSGKWYAEVTIGDKTEFVPGIANGNMVAANRYLGQDANTWAYYYDGRKVNSGTYTSYGNTYTDGDTIGIAFDADAGALYFYKNGAVQNSGTAAFTGLTSGPYFFACSAESSTTANSWNFGQRAFANTAPSGYKALCTQNLPPVTIGATSTTQANDYFNVLLETGTGSARSVTGLNFQPDFLWAKGSNSSSGHLLYDVVRGVDKSLATNTTAAEDTTAGQLTSFNSNGYSLPNDTSGYLNFSGRTYAFWNWNAGGSNQTISVGQYATSPVNVPSIASTVRANTTAGFSIVKTTGTGSAGTIGHGLGTAPRFIFGRNYSDAGGSNWPVYHASVGANNIGWINLTNAFTTSAATAYWNDTAPTSSVFSVGTNSNTNQSGASHIFYCFAPVAGYSAFGSYTGNGSTDGPFVFLGFRPRFIMIKASSSTGDWVMEDVARSPYNVSTNYLVANASTAEQTGQLIDFVSNGFKIRVAVSGAMNSSGVTYIYAAFAENPFKYSLAR